MRIRLGGIGLRCGSPPPFVYINRLGGRHTHLLLFYENVALTICCVLFICNYEGFHIQFITKRVEPNRLEK